MPLSLKYLTLTVNAYSSKIQIQNASVDKDILGIPGSLTCYQVWPPLPVCYLEPPNLHRNPWLVTSSAHRWGRKVSEAVWDLKFIWTPKTKQCQPHSKSINQNNLSIELIQTRTFFLRFPSVRVITDRGFASPKQSDMKYFISLTQCKAWSSTCWWPGASK